MGTPILETNIKRDPKKLYYCGTDKNGCILVCESIMNRKGRKRIKEKR